MKKYFREILSVVLGCVCAIVFFFTIVDREGNNNMIEIGLDVEAEEEMQGVQFYYTANPTQVFSQDKCVQSNKLKGKSHVKLKIPTEGLYHLRMDFGTSPGIVGVRNLTIYGEKTIRIDNYDDISMFDIDDYYHDATSIHINSKKLDPQIVFNYPIDVKAKKVQTRTVIHSACLFFIFAFLIYLIICAVAKKAENPEQVLWRRTFACVLLSGAAAVAFANYMADYLGARYSLPIIVSFDARTEVPTDFSLYYTSSREEFFNEQNITNKKVDAGFNHVEMQLATENLHSLRIDFGSLPKHVSLANMQIMGEETIRIDDFYNSQRNDLDDFSYEDGVVSIESNKLDPFLVFLTSFDLKCKKTSILDMGVFFATAFLAMAFLCLLSLMLMRYTYKYHIEDVVFVLLFLLTCIVPTFFLTDETVSQSEKRALATSPELSSDRGFNTEYSTQFDTWYNDHFPDKDYLVSLNNAIFMTKHNAKNESVFEGEDGWLFYKKDHMLETYANIKLIDEAGLDTIKLYLATINEWCLAHGKKFYFLLCPNKATIYGEYMKHIGKLDSDDNSDAMRFVRHMRGSGVNIIFSKDELMKHKADGDLLYWKQDTHHNHLGAYYSYKTVMDYIEKDFGMKATSLDSLLCVRHNTYQIFDLRNYIRGVVEEDTTNYMYIYIEGEDAKVNNNGPSVVLNNESGKNRLYILGDSFSSLLQRMFYTNFQRVTVNRETQYWFSDDALNVIDKEADILLLEVVERHLSLLAIQSMSPQLKPFKDRARVKLDW